MIEELRSVLSSFPVTVHEEPTQFVIKPNHYLGGNDFPKVAAIVRDYGGHYASEGKDSHFIVPKKTEKKLEHPPPEPTRKPAANKFTKSLPEGTMITISYGRKVCPKQYESLSLNASVEVPADRREDGYLTVVEFVESALTKRLKQLEAGDSS